MTARLIVFPPSWRTAHRLACRLRTEGFYSLPDRIWNNAADLVEHLTDASPTSSQLMWLWSAHQSFLDLETGR
jgi:hypothetical protein